MHLALVLLNCKELLQYRFSNLMDAMNLKGKILLNQNKNQTLNYHQIFQVFRLQFYLMPVQVSAPICQEQDYPLSLMDNMPLIIS